MNEELGGGETYMVRYSSARTWRQWKWMSLAMAAMLGLLAVLMYIMFTKMTRIYHMRHLAVPHSMVTLPAGLLGFLLAEWAVLTFFIGYIGWKNEKKAKPLVALSRAGIELHTQVVDLEMLRWDEIREVRAYGFLMHRMVGITPIDIS